MCAHISNLIVQERILLLNGNFIDRIRKFIITIASSPIIASLFKKAYKAITLPYKRIPINVPTIWNSTYKMLNIVLTY